jgi:mono/diheme cytochrome c family protein/ketosteroid isomerase-like protein
MRIRRLLIADRGEIAVRVACVVLMRAACMKKILLGFVLAIAIVVAVGGIAIRGGLYNVGADQEHSGFVYSLLRTTRDRSIANRAADIEVPDLSDAQRITRGAGNYDAMCVGCHRAPGVSETELSRGLYPSPPNLSTVANLDPARAFWAIKHGIKSTGMPAWGKSMQDSYIWDMVALLRELPKMDAERYAAEVRSSGGHSHGGRESGDHDHEDEDGENSSTSAAGHSHEEHEHSHSDAGEHSHEQSASSQPASAASKEVLRAVEEFHLALSKGDEVAVSRLLDPAVLIMEGGNVERSREEYAGHHLKADAKFMRSVKYTLERQTGDSMGDLAWVASEAVLTGESQGARLDLVSTESLVLKRSASGWRIVHIHWSSRDRAKA